MAQQAEPYRLQKVENSKLSNFERRLFEELMRDLSERDSQILGAQLNEINRIDRLVGDVQIEFWKFKLFRVNRERKRKFNTRQKEFLVPFVVEIDGKSISGDMVLIEDRLFSLEFVEEMKIYRKRTDFTAKFTVRPSLS